MEMLTSPETSKIGSRTQFKKFDPSLSKGQSSLRELSKTWKEAFFEQKKL